MYLVFKHGHDLAAGFVRFECKRLYDGHVVLDLVLHEAFFSFGLYFFEETCYNLATGYKTSTGSTI